MAQEPRIQSGGENLTDFLKPEDLLTPEGWQKAQRIAGRLPLSYEFSRKARREQLAREAESLGIGKSSVVGTAVQAAKGVEVGATQLPEVALGATATGGSLVRQFGEGLGERRSLPPRVIIPGQAIQPRKEIPPGPISRGIAKVGSAIEEVVQEPLEAARAATEYAEKKYGENLRPGWFDQTVGQFMQTAVISAPSAGAGFVGSRVAYPALKAIARTSNAAHSKDLFHMGITGGQVSRAAEKIGLASAAMTGGATSAGSIFNEVYKQLIEEGISEEEARELAAIPAGVSFVSTSLITAMFGPRGVEAGVALKTPKTLWRKKVREILHGAKLEATEEMIQEGVDVLVEKLTYNPDLTVDEAAYQMLIGFIFGGTLGGGMELIMSAAYGRGRPDFPGKLTPVNNELTIDPDAGKTPEQKIMWDQEGGTFYEPIPQPELNLTEEQKAERERIRQRDQAARDRSMALNDYWDRVSKMYSDQVKDENGNVIVDEDALSRAHDHVVQESAAIYAMLRSGQTGTSYQEAQAAIGQANFEASIRAQQDGVEAPPAPEIVTTDPSKTVLGLLVEEEARIRARKAVGRSPAAPLPLEDVDPYTQRMYRLWLRDKVHENFGPVVHPTAEGTPLAEPVVQASDEEIAIQATPDLESEVQRLLQRVSDVEPTTEPIPSERAALSTQSPVTVDQLLTMTAAELRQVAEQTGHPGGPTGVGLSIGHNLTSEADYRRIKAEYERINALVTADALPEGMSIEELVDLGTKASILGEVWKAADGTDTNLEKYSEYKPKLTNLKDSPVAAPGRTIETLEQAQKAVDREQNHIDSLTESIFKKKSQIGSLLDREKGRIPGQFEPKQYRGQRITRQNELNELNKRLRTAKQDLDKAKRVLKLFQSDATLTQVTQAELEQAAAIAQDLGSIRPVNLKSKTGWTLKKASDALKRLAQAGVVVAPPTITKPYTLTERGAAALSPAHPAQVTTQAPSEPTAAVPEPAAAVVDHVVPVPRAPDAPAVTPEQQSIIDTLSEMERQTAKRQAELEKQIIDRMREGRVNLLGDPKLIGLQTQYVAVLFSRGIIRSAQVAKTLVRKFGTSVLAHFKTIYQRARGQYVGKEALDTEAQIDKTLKDQSYRYLFTKTEREDLLGEPLPTIEHLRATIPKLPDKYTQTEDESPVTQSPEIQLAKRFWITIHEYFSQYPADWRPEAHTMSREGEIVAAILHSDKVHARTYAATVPPAKAREIAVDLLARYLRWRDATLVSRHVTVSNRAAIDRSKYPTQDIVIDGKPLTLESWLDLRSDQMDEVGQKHGIGASGLALAVGRQLIRSEADIAKVTQAYRDARLNQFEAVRKKLFSVVNRNAEKLELLQSAVEVATGQGKMADSMVKDPSYSPNVHQNVDFTALMKETVEDTMLRKQEPHIPKAELPKIGYPPVTQLRTALMEQMVISLGPDFDNWARSAGNLNLAENAYVGSLQASIKAAAMQGKDPSVVTQAMRADALDAAKSRGYRALPSDQKPRVPTLYGAPEGSPTGNRLYRTVTKLKNGTRTVAIETDHVLYDDVMTLTYSVDASYASEVDHITITINGSFAGFRAFQPTVPTKSRNELYAVIKATPPSPEFMPVPVTAMTRYRWLGERSPTLTRPFKEIMAAQTTTMTQDEVDNLLKVVDALESNDGSRLLLTNFIFDIYHQSYGVFDRDKEGAPIKEYERKQPKFVAAMMDIRRRALFGDSFVRDGVAYRTMSIPGLIKPMSVPIDGLLNADAEYAAFVNLVTDVVTHGAIRILIRHGMGLRTGVMFAQRRTPDEVYTPQLGVGVGVTLTRGGVKLQGTIVSARDIATSVKDTPARLREGAEVLVRRPNNVQVNGVVTAINKKFVDKISRIRDGKRVTEKVQDDFYDVEAIVDGKQVQLKSVPIQDIEQVVTRTLTGTQALYDVQVGPREKPRIIRNVFENELTAIPRKSTASDYRYGYRVIELEDKNLGNADPKIFDGEPFVSKLLLGVPLRDIAQSSKDPELKKKVLPTLRGTHPKLIIEALRKLRADESKIAKIWKQEEVSEVTKTRRGVTKVLVETVEAKAFPASISNFDASAKTAHTKLANLLIDRVAELYQNVLNVTEANVRIKAYMSRAALRVQPQSKSNERLPVLKRLRERIKNFQSRPNSQDKHIAKDLSDNDAKGIEEFVLPPRDADKAMRYRLIAVKTFGTRAAWNPEHKIAEKVTRVPMGPFILRVFKEGQQQTKQSKFRMKTALDKDKTIEYELLNTWLAVSGDEALIQVWNAGKNRYDTVYKVNLPSLPKGVARKFTHTIKKEHTGGKDMAVSGWYITPEVIANSGKNADGESIWVPASKDARTKYLSYEDFADYLNDTIANTPGWLFQQVESQPGEDPLGDLYEERLLAPLQEPGAVAEQADWRSPSSIAASALPRSTAALFGILRKIGKDGSTLRQKGQAIISDLEGGRVRVDQDIEWQSIQERIANLLYPDWEATRSDVATDAKLENIEAALDAYRRLKMRQAGIGAVSQGAPLVSDIDQSLLDQPATGKQAIRELVANPNNGFNEDVRAEALLLIDLLPEPILRHLTLVIQSSNLTPGEPRVVYGGSFSHALRLARVIAGSTNHNIISEEIAHSVAEFLPKAHRDTVESNRMREIQTLRDDPATPDNVREFLDLLWSNDGAISSEQFVGKNRSDWLDYYPLINTDEYFAHNLTDAARRANKSDTMPGPIGWAINWIREFINSVRQWLGNANITKNSFFDNLIKDFSAGKFNISVNGGYLHEVNAMSDIGGVLSIMGGRAKIRAIARLDKGRDPVEVGRVLMGQGFTLQHVFMDIENQMATEGEELKGRARQAASFDFITDAVSAVSDYYGLSLDTYTSAKMHLKTEAMRNAMAVGSMGAIKFVEKRAHRTKLLAKKWSDRIQSEEFQKLLNEAEKARAKQVSTEILQKTIEGQLNLSVQAAIDLVREQAASAASYTAAVAHQKRMENLLTLSHGITQMVEQMAQALASTQVGSQLLMGSSTLQPADVLQAWYDTSPPMTQANDDVITAAAWLLATKANLRNDVIASLMENDEAVLASVPGFVAKLAGMMAKPNNGMAIANVFNLHRRAGTAEAKAAFLLEQRMRPIRKIINHAQAMDQAARFTDRVINHPAWLAWRQTVAADVGLLHIPYDYQSYGMPRAGKNIRLPMPISNAEVTFSLSSDQATYEKEQVKAALCMEEIEEWLSTPGNQDSIDAVYLRWWRDFCSHAINSSSHNDFQKIWVFGFEKINQAVNEGTGLLDGMLRMRGSRLTQGPNEALRAWRNSGLMMDKWSSDYSKPILLKIEDAAKSHEASDDVDMFNPSTAASDWKNKVQRELFAFVNMGWEFKPGDALPATGTIVTAEDLACLDLQVKAIDAAMSLDATRGMSRFVPRTLVEDQLVPGVKYQRLSQKTEKDQTVRKFNQDAVDWTKQYYEKAILTGDLNARRKLIDDAFDRIIPAFLGDRDSDFWKSSPMDAAYTAAHEQVKDGRITNIEELENFLNQEWDNSLAAFVADPLSPLTEDMTDDSGVSQFYEAFDAIMTTVYKSVVAARESDTNPKFYGGFSVAQENPFTVGRGRRIAPYWWYDYGFSGDADLINFKLNGSSFYMEKVIEGFVEVEKLVNDRLSEMKAEILAIQNRRRVSSGEAEKIYVKENRLAIEKGDETAYFYDLQVLHSNIKKMIDYIHQNYTQGGKIVQDDLVRINRVVGTMVGAVLASVNTAGRNWIQSGFAYNGQRIGRLFNNLPLGYGMAGYEMGKQIVMAIGYGPIALIHNARRIHGINAALAVWDGLKSGLKKIPMTAAYPFLSEKARRRYHGKEAGVLKHLLRAEAEIVGEWVQESAESMFKLSRHYQWMRDSGLLMPMNLRAELLTIANDPEAFGIVSKHEEQKSGKSYLDRLAHITGIPNFLRNFAGFWHFQVQIFRSLMPRAGDVGANIAGFNTALSAVRHMESHLRRRWERLREITPADQPVQLPKKLSVADIVPGWFGEPRTQTALALLNEWCNHAGVDLRTTVNRFWASLDSAADAQARKDLTWLNDEEAFSMGQSHIEDMNVPTNTNRPYAARNSVFARAGYALHGWRLNMLSLQSQLAGKAAEEKVTARALFSYILYTLGTFIIAGMGGQAGFEEFARFAARRLFGGEQRSSRQLWERQPRDAWKQAISDAATIIPYLDTLANSMFNDQPGRKSLRVGDPFVVLNQAQNILNYGAGAINARSIVYGSDNLMRGNFPVTKIAINNMPRFQGRVRHINAVRLITRWADMDMLRIRNLGSEAMAGSLANKITPYYDRMINAAMLDDYQKVSEIFEEGVQAYMNLRGVDQATARQRVRSGYTSRNPYTRALERLPTEQERQTILNRMRDSQRIEVLAAEERFRRGAQQIGATVNFTQEQSSGARRTPQPMYMPARVQEMQRQGGYVPESVREAQRRREQQMRNRLTPQASRLQ